jgi:hypothetical protein
MDAENHKKSTLVRVREIADTVRLDDNDTPVLDIQVRYYEGGHLFLRGHAEDGSVAAAVGCNDIAEAIVLTGDIVRRANGKAKKLIAQAAKK